MKKNAISWRRTIVGSTLEILAPVFLMFCLVITRTIIVPTTIGNFDIYQIKKPIYPTATLDANNKWTNTNYFASTQGYEMKDFLSYTEYSAATEVGDQFVYNPFLDPFSPYYFFPPHCRGSPSTF